MGTPSTAATTHLPASHSINQTKFHQPTNQSINQSVNQSKNQSIHPSTSPSVNQSITQQMIICISNQCDECAGNCWPPTDKTLARQVHNDTQSFLCAEHCPRKPNCMPDVRCVSPCRVSHCRVSHCRVSHCRVSHCRVTHCRGSHCRMLACPPAATVVRRAVSRMSYHLC